MRELTHGTKKLVLVVGKRPQFLTTSPDLSRERLAGPHDVVAGFPEQEIRRRGRHTPHCALAGRHAPSFPQHPWATQVGGAVTAGGHRGH